MFYNVNSITLEIIFSLNPKERGEKHSKGTMIILSYILWHFRRQHKNIENRNQSPSLRSIETVCDKPSFPKPSRGKPMLVFWYRTFSLFLFLYSNLSFGVIPYFDNRRSAILPLSITLSMVNSESENPMP